MKTKNTTCSPQGELISFKDTDKYKVGDVTAVVMRTFAPAGKESISKILERLIITDLSEHQHFGGFKL